ncbi:hypothetical protein ACFLRF_05640 [Candidatus Altiarchaeota archaeon]
MPEMLGGETGWPVQGRQLHDQILNVRLKQVTDPAVEKEYGRLKELAKVLDAVKGQKTFIFDVDGTLTMQNFQTAHAMGLQTGDENMAAKLACSMPASLGLKESFELIKAHGHKVGVFSRISDPMPILFHLEQMGVGLENVDYLAVTGAGQENYADLAALKRTYSISGKHGGKSIAPTRALIRGLYPDETTDVYTFWKDRYGIEFVDVSLYGMVATRKDSMLIALGQKQRENGAKKTILDDDLILIGNSDEDTVGIAFEKGNEPTVKHIASLVVDEGTEVDMEAMTTFGHLLSDKTADGKRTIRVEKKPAQFSPDGLPGRLEYEFVPLLSGKVVGVRIDKFAAITGEGVPLINSIPKAMSVALAMSERERNDPVLSAVLNRYGNDIKPHAKTDDDRIECVTLERLPKSDMSAEYVRQLRMAPKFTEV